MAICSFKDMSQDSSTRMTNNESPISLMIALIFSVEMELDMSLWISDNGQVETSNKILQDCLNKRLEGAEGKWVDELPRVLWAYRITKRRSTGEYASPPKVLPMKLLLTCLDH
ncbi:hypothetical protein L3X38_032701 [Prunus dulcis]|uniref:Uncharacterized protein n=1 Tax=Prunus dulcis TaxID=3755 RepID=A0AAD4VFY5_PRUDU|nr:hypothetical protein L3X38_032701 [Prunus dulcis]